MNPQIFHVLFFLLLFNLCCKVSSQQNKTTICSEKNKRKIDLTFSRLEVVGDRVRRFPESLDQVSQFCK